jgi:hypothetical protein
LVKWQVKGQRQEPEKLGFVLADQRGRDAHEELGKDVRYKCASHSETEKKAWVCGYEEAEAGSKVSWRQSVVDKMQSRNHFK